MSKPPIVAKNGVDWFQREAGGIAAGDIFSIPLARGGYGFGRVMNAHDGADIAEFFRCWQPDAAYNDTIPCSGRLFSPVGIYITHIAYRGRKRSWKVIAKDPDYFPNDLYEIESLLANIGGSGYRYFTYDDHMEAYYGGVSQSDVDNGVICSNMPQHPDVIVGMIEEQLRKQNIYPL